jgi:hypothetical protein
VLSSCKLTLLLRLLLLLLLPTLLLQPTYEERAAAMEEVLVWFLFAIPRARGRPVDAWCSRPDGAAVRRAAQAALVAEQVQLDGMLASSVYVFVRFKVEETLHT